MCGIAGFTRFNNSTGDKETLVKMGNSIIHRGPDAHGEYLDDDIGLCHRRLSIIDLSVSGNQPMFSADGNIVLVFNGEIYNFLTLREEVEKMGYGFKTRTDTEVILALYTFFGKDLIHKINGMFAFALWDKNIKSLFLARDRLGKKPLYYYDDGTSFFFGSEIKSILVNPSVKKDIQNDAIYDFFTYQYIPDPKTIFKYIHKLKPGHWMEVNKNGIKHNQYWDLSFNVDNSQTEDDVCNELYRKLESSVRERMVSDVPLGAFLSGGVDSSAIVGLMALNQNSPVKTCSIGFDSEKFDEIDYARKVSDIFQTEHHEFTVRSTVQDNLKHIVSFFDEPFADPSLVPTYFVSELARQKVTVALAGDGGDENFAGYNKYSIDNTENNLRRLFPGALRRSLFPLIARLLRKNNTSLFRKGSTLLNTLSLEPDYGFFLSNSFFNDILWKRIINDDLKKSLKDYHPSSITTAYYNSLDSDDHLARILYSDFKTYLPGDILVKVDRMSMANSLEVRAPILDYKVVEYVASIPSNLKYRKREKKYILKKTFSQMLPEEILYRKKMGFSTPLSEWLRNEIKPLSENSLFSPNSGLSNFFNLDTLLDIWQKHQTKQADFSTELWSFLMFELWWQRYMENS